MRNNEEFKDLVNKKHNALLAKRTANRRRIITAVSCFLVCVVVAGTFFGKGITFNNGGDVSQNTFFDIEEDNGKDSLHADIINSNSEKVESDSKSEASPPEYSDTSNYTDAEVSHGEPSDITSGEPSDIIVSEPNEDTTVSDVPDDVPSYSIVPDDFPDITETVNLMQYLSANKPSFESSPFDDTDTRNGIADFSFELFKSSYESGKNNLLSPTSALYTMAMITNGADGNTKEQLINTICGTELDRLNEYMCEYRTIFGTGKGYNTRIDNAVWYDESVTVDKNFLQTNYDYYGIEAFKTIFDSQEVLDSINGWVYDKTNGLIDKFAEKIDSDIEMAVANTLYFEAKWYDKLVLFENQIFKKENGEKVSVTMMQGECFRHVENDQCVGFIFDYESKYSFVGLLPKENISVGDLINSLNQQVYDTLLANENTVFVRFKIPKFETDDTIDIKSSLKKMGITDMFYGETANLSKMAVSENGNLFVSEITQKTTISVHEDGTLAAAATELLSKPDDFVPPYIINLDRPFVYLIIDNTTNLPLFMGTVEDF